ncbi:unnamed protein product [Echinostoma caproni]|uniref:Similar to n=1 Tax=Echinostoma caproni TaxID=27848 RepID=A0A183AKU7_9TREM|nr:unnamed protein product [Echinostoma caproni]
MSQKLSTHVARLEQQVNELLDQLAQCNQHHVDSQSFLSRPPTRPLTIHSPNSPQSVVSPRRSPVPHDSTSHTFFRPRSGTDRGQFVDDELIDQPQLSFVPPSALPLSWLSSTPFPVNRVTSWPLLSPRVGFPWSVDLDLDRTDIYVSARRQTHSPYADWHSTAPFQRGVSNIEEELNPGLPANDTKALSTSTGHCPRMDKSTTNSKQQGLEKKNLIQPEPATTESTQISSASPSSQNSTSESGPMLRELQDLLDDAAFIRRLENIYALKLQCGVPSLTSTDYQPQYKQLFRDAFRMLRELKRGKMPHRMVPVVEEKS